MLSCASEEWGSGMWRRKFLALVGGAAVAWPFAARAQQSSIPVIGFLSSASPDVYAHVVHAFRLGLSETGHVEGRNVAIEFRFADGQNDRLPELAADLVRRQVDVIVAGGTSGPAKQATTTIPIVFTTGVDPVQAGLVTSINRPGGNITGVTFYSGALGGKQLELLREVAPKTAEIGLLVNSKALAAAPQIDDARAVTRAIGLQFYVLNASSEPDIDL